MTVESPRIETNAAAQSLDNKNAVTKGLRGIVLSILEYFLMLLLIIEFNTAYLSLPMVSPIIYNALLLILIILILFRAKSIKIDYTIFLIIIGGLFPMLNIAEGSFGKYVRLYMVFFPLCLIYLSTLMSNSYDKAKNLLLKFSNIILVVAIVSLFFWILGSQLNIISYTFVVPNIWGTERFIPTYYGLYFETQEVLTISSGTESTVRNSGIFNEAPMYNMMLCTALAVELFIREHISKFRVIVLVCTIFTTYSTTGYIFLIMVSVLILLTNKKMTNRRLLIILFPFILGGGYYMTSKVLESKKDTGEGSYISRGSDILRCIDVGLENPILGVGIMHGGREYGSKKNNFGYSNSLFGTFAHGGFYFLSLYIILLLVLPFLIYKQINELWWILVYLGYFVLFTFTVSQYKYCTIFFMAYSYAYWNVIAHNKHTKSQIV